MTDQVTGWFALSVSASRSTLIIPSSRTTGGLALKSALVDALLASCWNPGTAVTALPSA
ncbi:hypothetical protein [Pendulispora albinea]|uniref:Uncharacterized protein n=1 Tax=Pendulispora albinea TaxID=2741071 RepID=A0ABZ2M8Y9_9BACT